MKSKKETVYDFIKQSTDSGKPLEGVSTQYLARRLEMQRSNVSSILNELVKEGAIEKTDGRPVLYRIPSVSAAGTEKSCFSELIGNAGSLKGAVQLAKAAILYPGYSLPVLITGPEGSGKREFAKLISRFAQESNVTEQNPPFITFNCSLYAEKQQKAGLELFGISSSKEEDALSCLQRANGGILFIDRLEYLDADTRIRIMDLSKNIVKHDIILICSIGEEGNHSLIEMCSISFPVRIQLTPLEMRPLQERFGLICRFFTNEAMRCGRTLSISYEIMTCLLLYQCRQNISQLKNDMKLGCATAYARDYQRKNTQLELLLSDFPFYVRSGYLELKGKREDLKKTIRDGYTYLFTPNEEIKTRYQRSTPKPTNIYEWIDKRTGELKNRGLEAVEINTLISIDIEHEFQEYSRGLGSHIINREQLALMTTPRLIELVTEFINGAVQKFDRIYSQSLFYGLCLHLDSALKHSNRSRKLNGSQILETAESHKREYAYCTNFIARLEQEFNLSLPVDEAVFLTMFLCKGGELPDTPKPVLLIIMHGSHGAASLSEVVSSLSGTQVWAYDIPLEQALNVTYEGLRSLILKINQGKGVFALYDMGSVSQLLDMLEQETGIPVQGIEIPITALALDISRKLLLNSDMEETASWAIQNYHADRKNRKKGGDVIITLCMSGEGGAILVKTYLEKTLKTSCPEIIPLAISRKKELLLEIDELRRHCRILCIISSYDPQIVGISYIPISEVLECSESDLPARLNLTPESAFPPEGSLTTNDYDVIFDHLKEQSTQIDINRLKPKLLKAINHMETASVNGMTKDIKIGLLVHIFCCIQHLTEGKELPVNIYAPEIIERNPELYQAVKESMQDIERTFGITFSDMENANVISIIKRSRKG